APPRPVDLARFHQRRETLPGGFGRWCDLRPAGPTPPSGGRLWRVRSRLLRCGCAGATNFHTRPPPPDPDDGPGIRHTLGAPVDYWVRFRRLFEAAREPPLRPPWLPASRLPPSDSGRPRFAPQIPSTPLSRWLVPCKAASRVSPSRLSVRQAAGPTQIPFGAASGPLSVVT